MVITQTPFRVSFFGGGTDFPDFYRRYGGQVLSTSIDKYCYVTVRHLPPFFDHSIYLAYSQQEKVRRVEDIQHPLVREAMRYLEMDELTILYDADLPARTGLGTSSSFAVGLLSAFYSLKGKYVGKERLAKEAIKLERELCGESGGIQDQIAAAYGGFNKIVFNEAGFQVYPVIIKAEIKEALNANLMMFFTGMSRISSTIQVEQEKNLEAKHRQLLEQKDLVDKAEKALVEGRIDDFGRLLDVGWRLKREINNRVSNGAIDEYYNRAMKAGALGGKLLGAGGGGFLLLYVREAERQRVRGALSNLMEIPFRFEEGGNRILYYVPEMYNYSERRLMRA